MRRGLLLFALVAVPLAARAEGAAFLVRDVNPGARPGFSSPAGFTPAGAGVVFTASEPTTGRELWVTDGSEPGTALLRDLRPGTGSSFEGFAPFDLVPFGSLALFAANDGASGEELWKTDGTAGGTALVKDVRAGRASSGPTELAPAGALVLFTADDGAAGRELWKTDGTTAGTALVKDVRAGSATSSPAELVAAGTRVFFSADDGAAGRELWSSDGTGAGTALAKDVRAGATGSFPAELTAVGGLVFFSADDGSTGRELWVSDGSAAGTVRVKDIRPGAESSLPRDLVASGGALFFSAFDGADWTLWTSDGSAAGTHAVGGLASIAGRGPPRGMVDGGGSVFFSAEDPNAGRELFASDGTPAGTGLVRDLKSGPDESFVHALVRLAPGLVAFVADDGANGPALWRSDGTLAGTTLAGAVVPASGATHGPSLAAIAGTLYLNASDGASGYEPWASDGTPGGTRRLANIRSDAAGSDPLQLSALGDRVVFTAHDGALFEDDGATGREPWVTDGTLAGTVQLADVRMGAKSSDPVFLGVAGGKLLFSAFDTVRGRELWATDGTQAGTALVKNIAPGTLSSIDAGYTDPTWSGYFAAEDYAVGRELWKSDGTSAGTVRVKDIRPGPDASDPRPFGQLGNLLFLTAVDATGVRAVWTSDGSDAGTTFLKDLRPVQPYPPSLGGVSESAVVNGVLFFRAVVGGEQLWRTDGTAAGTVQLIGVDPSELESVNGRLLFRRTWTGGVEPWVSDGTDAGTVRLLDVNPTGDSVPGELTHVRGKVFFRADDGANGAELWLTDGTAAGTRMVKDIWPGAGGSSPSGLREVNGRLYFAANDGVEGEELWSSDGTAAGTGRVAAIVPGSGGSAPAELEPAGGLLLFTAEQPGSGREPWAIELPCGNGALDSGEDCDDGNTADGDGCAATCESEGALELEGTAQGGSLSLDVAGEGFVIATSAGQSAAAVAGLVALAVNTNTALSLQGVWALLVGGRLVTNGAITEVDVSDPGLALAGAPEVPALGPGAAFALALLLAAAAALARRRRRAAAVLFALTLVPAARGSAQFPVISPSYEVTDASVPQTTADYNNETTNVVQRGRSLYVVYHVNLAGTVADPHVYLRRFDLDTMAFDPPVRISDLGSPPSYHDEPTLVQDALGGLLVLYPYTMTRQISAITDRTYRPRQRAVRDLAQPWTWSAPTGLPGRVPNDFLAWTCVDPLDPVYGACGAQTYDCSSVFEERTGTAHFVCEGAAFAGLDGADAGGLSRIYWRIHADGRLDGPYVLVDAPTNYAPPNSLGGGNIFAKGDLYLGNEPAGPRSLHLIWEIRNSYAQLQDPNLPRDEDPNSPGYNPVRSIQHNYDLYHARSDDGGDSWRNVTGTVARALVAGLDWNDPNFRFVADELQQEGSRSCAIDAASRPFCVYGRHRPGTGRMVWGHVDAAWPGAQYDMVWTRWNGSAWTSGLVEENTAGATRLRVRLDLEGKIWLFASDPLRWSMSGDGGVTWSAWAALGVGFGRRPHSMADRLDPNYHYVFYQDGNARRNYFVRMQLTNVALP